MKYWYFVFKYNNQTRNEEWICDRVISSTKEYFPLKEVNEMAIKELKDIPEVDGETDFDNDEITIMIDNQFQIDKEDFDVFNKELKNE